MRIQRISFLSLAAVLVFSSRAVFGSDFAERVASWQSGAPVQSAAPPVGRQPAMMPEGMPSGQRVINDEYSAALTGHAVADQGAYGGCQSCGHGQPAYDMAGPGSCGSCGGYGGYGGCNRIGWPFLWGGSCHSNSCGGGCGYDCGDSCGANCCNTLVWAKLDVLLWWRQGRDLPGLVTTDPVTEDSTTAGILPDATIIFGNDRIGTDVQAGGRFDLGAWFDTRQCWGYGWRFFGLGKDSSEFNRNSFETPVLAIPFTDADTGDSDALLVAFPGLRSGEVHVASSADLISNDVYGRFLLCRGCDGGRLDFITGWNYTRLADRVTIRTRSTVTEISGTIPNGTVTDTFDTFRAHNTFNGAILGLMYERDCGCWTTNWLGRMSIGGIHESVEIDGSSTVSVPGEDVETVVGGVFTGDSNIGTATRNEFTAITEVGFNLGYRWGPCTRLNAGYTLLYWNDIVSPGTAIDTTVGTDDRPAFAFRHSDYWVQGLNLGLTREF